MSEQKKTEEEKEKVASNPEQNVLEQMGFTGRGYRVKVYKTGPATHKGKRLKTGCVAQYEGDALPTLDDIQQECAAEYGGGNYTVRVQSPDNTWVKGGTHSFTIDIEEYEPRYAQEDTQQQNQEKKNMMPTPIPTEEKHSLDPRELLRDRDYDIRFRSLEEKFDRLLSAIVSGPKDDGAHALVAAINSSTQATLAAMQASTNANLEAMKLVLAQTQSAKEDQARREEVRSKESRENLQVLLSSLEKSFETATQSQRAISEALQSNKSEIVEMLKTMVLESKQSSEQMVSTVLSVLLQGIEMGKSTAAPESDLQVITKSITEGIKAVSDVHKAPSITDEQIRKVAMEAVQKVAPKPSDKKTDSEKHEQEQSERDMANKVSDYLIGLLKEKPGKHDIISKITSMLPLPVNERVRKSRDWTVVFDWVRDNAAVEKVNALGELLIFSENASWFENALREEIASYGGKGEQKD